MSSRLIGKATHLKIERGSYQSNSSQNRAGLISKQFTQLADIFYEDDKKAEIYSELASLFMSSNIK